MRKAAGIALISLGAVWLAIYGIVMLRLPLPIPGFVLQRLGRFGLYVDPVVAPISALAFLTVGALLLWRKRRIPKS